MVRVDSLFLNCNFFLKVRFFITFVLRFLKGFSGEGEEDWEDDGEIRQTAEKSDSSEDEVFHVAGLGNGYN